MNHNEVKLFDDESTGEGLNNFIASRTGFKPPFPHHKEMDLDTAERMLRILTNVEDIPQFFPNGKAKTLKRMQAGIDACKEDSHV